jgi:hypothetical protein
MDDTWHKDTFDENDAWIPDEQGEVPWKGTCKHARYHRRYKTLAESIQTYDRQRTEELRPGTWNRNRCEVKILVLAAGVTGVIPNFTTKNLGVFLDKKQVVRVKRSLILAAYAAAIKAYTAWRKEG